MELESYLDGSYLFDWKRLARAGEAVRRAGLPSPAERFFTPLFPFGMPGPMVLIPPIEPPPIAPMLPPVPPSAPGLFLYP